MFKGYVYIFELNHTGGSRGDEYYETHVLWSDNNINRYSIRNTRNTKKEDSFVLEDYFVSNQQLDRYNLLDGEKICINMQRQTIESDNTTVPSRMINCNQKWIKLEHGKNVFEITGKGIFTFRCQYPVII